MTNLSTRIPILSSITRSLRFASLVHRFPEQRDFISIGFGIEARYQRCKKYWQKHLEFSRQFQIEALSKLGSGLRVAILGAGRLLDVPCDYLVENQHEVSLFDADPGCAAVWQRNGFTGDCSIDVSANFSNFSECVRNVLTARQPTLPKLAAALDQLEIVTPKLPAVPYDVVISLNLLSQIPLYFHDFLDRELETAFGVGADDDGVFSAPICQTWLRWAERLQRAHQELVSGSATRLTVVITDRSFLYYKREQAVWRECQALYLPLQQDNRAAGLSDGWFWHIAPQGLEQPDFGVIHDVQARAHFY